ncbi:acyltransferase [Metabacillus sp. Hm71]|uniref:acyltransferase n=1 Tax=Metabacillus sp. Hm71 TaxID=3450743 RepID=UPI003F4233C9
MDRNYAIDFIKFFAILAVVTIHTVPKDSIFGLFVLDNLSRFAVPFFFSTSGYLFGKKMKRDGKTFRYFKRYVLKILKLYVCWVVFYAMYDILILVLSSHDLQSDVMDYVKNFTLLNVLYYGKGTSGYQLWFLPALIWSITIIYLFFKMKKINILIIVAFVLNIIGLFGQSYAIFYEFPLNTRDALFIGIFYTTLGFFFALNLESDVNHLSRKAYLSFVSLFCILQVVEGFILEKVIEAKNGEYFISTIFLTFSLFSYILTNKQLGKGRFLTRIGANALGIYAIHVFFIDMIDKTLSFLHLNSFSDHFVWKLVDTVIVFSLSYLAYGFLQHVKDHIDLGKSN